MSPGYQIMSVWNAKFNYICTKTVNVMYIIEIKYPSFGTKIEQTLTPKFLTCHSRRLFPVDHYQPTVERLHDHYHLSSLWAFFLAELLRTLLFLLLSS